MIFFYILGAWNPALVHRKINHLQEAALGLRKNIYALLLYLGFLAHHINLITCVLILLREDTVRIITEELLQPFRAQLQPTNQPAFKVSDYYPHTFLKKAMGILQYSPSFWQAIS